MGLPVGRLTALVLIIGGWGSKRVPYSESANGGVGVRGGGIVRLRTVADRDAAAVAPRKGGA